MSVPIHFTVHTIPVAQPRQRTRLAKTRDGKSYTQNYTPVRHPVNAFKAAVQLAWREAHDGPPLEEPIRLGGLFIMPRPKGKCWKTKATPRYPHTGRPDLDNLVKAVKDALSGLAWRDDSQVWRYGDVSKVVASGSEGPRVEVVVEPESEAVTYSSIFGTGCEDEPEDPVAFVRSLRDE